MYLRNLTFRENEGKSFEWLIDDVQLGRINLIVGENSSGKTRTLNALSDLVDLLTGGTNVPKVHGRYMALFIHEKEEVQLNMEFENGFILSEVLNWKGKEVLKRVEDGTGKIAYMGGKEEITLDFGISRNQLACFAKRDKLQHPFLENIYKWAYNMRRFDFSGNLGKDKYALKSSFEKEEIDFRDTRASLVPVLYLALEEFQGFKEILLKDMQDIGYMLEDIGIVEYSEKYHKSNQDRYAVYTTEAGLEKQVNQNDMSQGMFRAFSVLVRINRYILSGMNACVVIDDIGEGLDFSRARKLVNLLVKKAESSGLQLIMSTNDSFIMNSVDIENWAVLQRDGNKITLYNYENSKEIFEEFKFTGLNNFDFFASKFFNTGFTEETE